MSKIVVLECSLLVWFQDIVSAQESILEQG